ncbi:hypothetical protein [Paraburkholderia humisilvae]|uniref:Uncharacterized protein n=1 Tax=Paraburkholderia humisilvae TaxID=627669 RepID=A0A6J5DKJ6_9BURK|nr:hypothetical protein [Paraburkholderia humisilvae]CAB3753967.1 hypothetical protein LMG29542_02205 [Paraburkholderia humisilvae]
MEPTNSLSRIASWVIREKATGRVFCEVFDEWIVKRLNTVTYEAVPILQYLQSLNRV